MTSRSSGDSTEKSGGGSQLARRVTRRQALQGGAAALGALALEADPASAHAKREHASASAGRLEVSFDDGWLFHYGDAAGADAPSFDDSSWRTLDVPHDWRIEDIPTATSDDGGASSDPAVFASISDPSMNANTPRQIGPFNADEDPSGASIKGSGHGEGFTVSTVGWYRKHFTVPTLIRDESDATPDGDEQRVELLFGGVYQNADFWLNGKHVAFHPNGYVSFALDLTPYLSPTGANVLAVRVDCSGRTSRFYSPSGIHRHTWLTVTGPVRIPLWGTVVTTPVVDSSRSVAHVEVPVANSGSGAVSARVRVTLFGPNGRRLARRTTSAQPVTAGTTQHFTLDVPIKPALLWSPEAPNLYGVRAEVLAAAGDVLDADTVSFGIRSIVMNGKQGFLLNGRPVKMHGGNVHIDHGALGAVSLYHAEQRRVRTLKALGFNAIRTAHNPPSREFLDACDRFGMLVWDEFSDMWNSSKTDNDYSKYFADWWQRDLGGMVMRDRNHPCVVIWSLGNEISSSDDASGPPMAALVRSLDRTRPLTVGGTLDATVWSYVDVGDKHYITDYGSDHTNHPDKAMNQSESLPPDAYRVWKLCTDNVYAVGDFTWAAWDYIGETSVGATPIQPVGVGAGGQATGTGGVLGLYPYPWFQAYCGDVDMIGQRKPQSYWRAVIWGMSALEMAVERPTPPGTEQTAPQTLNWGYYDELQSWTWDVTAGQTMKVRVYTPGDQVKLLLNGNEIATNALTDTDQLRTVFSVPYAPGELTAVAYKGGKEIARKSFQTVGQAVALRLTADVSGLSTGRDDLAYVLVEINDAQGRLVPDAVVKVSFALTGAAALAGVANANGHNVDSFRRPRRWTYHGQALAIVRPAKKPGTLTLTATAPGLQPATLTLPVRAVKIPHPHQHRKRHRHPAHHGKRRHPTHTVASLASLGSGPALVLALAAGLLRRRIRHAASLAGDRPEL